MATSSQASSPAANAAVVGCGTGTTSTASHGQTIVGTHIFRIDGFSATKGLGVGKSVKSSTFRVGGQGWYIDCYPCGVHERSAGWVYLNLCRQEHHPGSRVSGHYELALMESLKDGCFQTLVHQSKSVTFADDDRQSLPGTDFFKREELESLLKDDCFLVRCIVFIDRQFPDEPPPDLATETVAWAHSQLLTVDGYTKTRGAYSDIESIDSNFRFAGDSWCLGFYPCIEDEVNKTTHVHAYICLDLEDPAGCGDEVKVRLEMTLLTLAGHIISSVQDFYTFSDSMHAYSFQFLRTMEHESSPLLQDGIQIRCDMAVVKGITAVPPPNQHQCFGVGGDVTFDVGGALFSAHKCVLATRSTAFMAEFFGPARKGNTGVVTKALRVDNMEPRVFKALLHFIYTDTLPEIRGEDMVVMAQGLLVAADRYAMERLKLICGDMLCSYIDAATAVVTQELADKHMAVPSSRRRASRSSGTGSPRLLPDPYKSEGVHELSHGPVRQRYHDTYLCKAKHDTSVYIT